MASKRVVKKHIEQLIGEVVSDCLNYIFIQGNKNSEVISEIIDDMIVLREDLIMRVNHIDGKENPKLVKAHFNKLYNDLLARTNEAYEKLSQMIQQNR